MTKQEMLNEIKSRQLKSAEILDRIASEKRELTNVEQVEIANYKKEISEFEANIKELDNVKPTRSLKVGGEKRFSLIKSIKDFVETRGFNDETLEVNEMGKKQMIEAGLTTRGHIILPYETRAIVNATTAGEGEYAIMEQKLDMIGALRGKLVAVQAGATLLQNLKGSVSIPVYAGTTSAWKAENVTATDGAGAFTEVTLSPHRITTILDISKQFLNQDTTGAENLLMSDLTSSVLARLEATMFSADAHGDNPAGLLNGVSYGDYTGATSWTTLVNMEGSIDTNNALTGSLCYITTPALRSKGKVTSKAGTEAIFVVDNNSCNGYPILSTSNMASGKVIFANWGELLLGSWGSLDLTVDPYTQAALGVVRLVVNSYWDFAKRRTAAFVYGNLT